MTPQQLNEILSDYTRNNLSPRKPEREMIAKRYDQLKSFLSGQTFQNGSYARHTSTTPVNDLDVFYILPETVRKLVVEARIKPEELTLDNILQDLASALQKEYGGEANVEVQPHSVGIFFGAKTDFSIDVVPAQPASDGMFWVPETALRSVRARRLLYASARPSKLRWIKSHPQAYIAQATKLDEITHGEFRKAAKFVKKWRHVCKKANDNFPLKSFHVEIAMTELLKAKPALKCLDAIKSFFSILPQCVVQPQYLDKADPSKHIDDYVNDLADSAKSLVKTEHERVTPLVARIQNATTEAEVLRIIETLLSNPTSHSTSSPIVVGTPRTSPAYSKPYFG